jgi:dCTP deaminase
MSVLGDRQIHERITDGSITVDPLDSPELQIQPSSVDLCLGSVAKTYDPDVTYVTTDTPSEEAMITKEYEECIPIHPKDFLLIPTKEWIGVPRDLQGKVTGRSSIARLGIEIHSTAGLIDPGYEGQIVLEVSNNTNTTVEIETGTRVAQIMFYTLSEEADLAYGDRPDSKYQRQKGPTPSKIDEDPTV